MSAAQVIWMASAILLPVVLLVLAAIVLPRAMARMLGHGLWRGAVNFAVCAGLLTALSGGYFAADYALRDPRTMAFAGLRPLMALGHFAWLGLMAGLIWAPILMLSLTAIPPEAGGGPRRKGR